MLPTDESTIQKRRRPVAVKSGGYLPNDENSQLALEVRALAELLLDIFEDKQERKKTSISGPEPQLLDADPERHTM